MTDISDATSRITLRQRRGRRRRMVLLSSLAAVLVVVGVLAWLLFGSAVLGVRSVEVYGAKLVAAAEVQRVAGVPDGLPLARVDLDAVATRVSGLPPVAKVSVARQWPNTIAVRITERTPALAIETPGGYWIADDQGVIFDSAGKAPHGVLPAKVPTGDPRLIRDLATVLRALPSDVRDRVREGGAATPDSIAFELTGGVQVVWGSAEESELKAQVLSRLMLTSYRVYDVSAPSNPVTK
ncbi:MAG: FtsQ-type POTRA domain-containing protein [Micropruina sp.]|uniref:cell division protein FtsQ/DivIB n=1 Tax=Micropruina sp. TaxID=2737536 RepID=UPI0039E3FCB9